MALYDEIGNDLLRDWVKRFYKYARADAAVHPYFYGVDTKRLKAHVVRLLVWLLGGPEQFDVSRLGPAHAKVRAHYVRRPWWTLWISKRVTVGPPITGPVFDRTVGMLIQAANELDIPNQYPAAFRLVVDTAYSLRDTIVQTHGERTGKISVASRVSPQQRRLRDAACGGLFSGASVVCVNLLWWNLGLRDSIMAVVVAAMSLIAALYFVFRSKKIA